MNKIVDEKGKLFGIINIVDLMVLLIIISLIAVVLIRVSTPSKNLEGTSIIDGKKEAYVTLYVQNAVKESLDTLNIGDKLVANNSFTTAEIVSIDSKPAEYITVDQNGNAKVVDHPLWLDLIITVKDEVNPSSPIIKIGGQEARVNYPIILKTQQFEANSKVRLIEFKDINSN